MNQSSIVIKIMVAEGKRVYKIWARSTQEVLEIDLN